MTKDEFTKDLMDKYRLKLTIAFTEAMLKNEELSRQFTSHRYTRTIQDRASILAIGILTQEANLEYEPKKGTPCDD